LLYLALHLGGGDGRASRLGIVDGGLHIHGRVTATAVFGIKGEAQQDNLHWDFFGAREDRNAAQAAACATTLQQGDDVWLAAVGALEAHEALVRLADAALVGADAAQELAGIDASWELLRVARAGIAAACAADWLQHTGRGGVSMSEVAGVWSRWWSRQGD